MFNKKVFIIIFIILISLALTIYFFVIPHFKNKSKENIEIENKPIFTIDKIDIYSSASAESNSNDYQKAYWNFDISQFSDIAIYINNKNAISELTPENTIKSLYIDNINYTQTPSIGTTSLYYKNYTDFGVNKVSRSNIINHDIDFQIYSSGEIDPEKPLFFQDCSNPITLGFVNKNVVSNYILLYEGNSVIYNGNLLEKAGISLDSLSTTISFNINIVNNLNEVYKCNVLIPIVLQEGNRSIYQGNIKTTQNSNFIFTKI